MRPGEWLVSVLVLGFLAVKVTEATLGIDSWPLTTVPMFAGRAGPEVVPMRMTLVGRRGETSVVLTARDFGLTDDELKRRVRSGGTTGAVLGCGLLGTSYNETHPPALRLDALEARFTRIPRPGVPSRGSDIVLPCSLRPGTGRPVP
jgi:hypothetical protein